MAIKISGTEVIDDSRNICNINTLNATTINAPVAGSYVCKYAYSAITEGELVSTDSDGVTLLIPDPLYCLQVCSNRVTGCALDTNACIRCMQEILINFPCSECNGCYIKLQLHDGLCCRGATCPYSCPNTGEHPGCICYMFNCASPGLKNKEELGGSVCIPLDMTGNTCCYSARKIEFSPVTLVCDPNGSLVSAIVQENCIQLNTSGISGSASCGSCACLREIVLCYCTATCALSLVRNCVAAFCSLVTTNGAGADANYAGGFELFVTPDNCYLVGMYGSGGSNQAPNTSCRWGNSYRM